MKMTPLQRFARENGLRLAVAKAIVRSAIKVEKTGVDYSNNDDGGVSERRYIAAQREFKALIIANGFNDYDMPGLWPTLIKDGKIIYLPCD